MGREVEEERGLPPLYLTSGYGPEPMARITGPNTNSELSNYY